LPPATLPHMGSAHQQQHAVTAQHPLSHSQHSPQMGRKHTASQPSQHVEASVKTNNPMAISMPTPQHPPTV
jgi:hypothetical protein